MAYELVWDIDALDDLEQIHSFISQNFSESVANQSINRILDRIDRLRTNPLSGTLEQNEYLTEEKFYFVLSGPSRIIYFITGQTIGIVRVFDSRQDPAKRWIRKG